MDKLENKTSDGRLFLLGFMDRYGTKYLLHVSQESDSEVGYCQQVWYEQVDGATFRRFSSQFPVTKGIDGEYDYTLIVRPLCLTCGMYRVENHHGHFLRCRCQIERHIKYLSRVTQ